MNIIVYDYVELLLTCTVSCMAGIIIIICQCGIILCTTVCLHASLTNRHIQASGICVISRAIYTRSLLLISFSVETKIYEVNEAKNINPIDGTKISRVALASLGNNLLHLIPADVFTPYHFIMRAGHIECGAEDEAEKDQAGCARRLTIINMRLNQELKHYGIYLRDITHRCRPWIWINNFLPLQHGGTSIPVIEGTTRRTLSSVGGGIV